MPSSQCGVQAGAWNKLPVRVGRTMENNWINDDDLLFSNTDEALLTMDKPQLKKSEEGVRTPEEEEYHCWEWWKY